MYVCIKPMLFYVVAWTQICFYLVTRLHYFQGLIWFWSSTVTFPQQTGTYSLTGNTNHERTPKHDQHRHFILEESNHGSFNHKARAYPLWHQEGHNFQGYTKLFMNPWGPNQFGNKHKKILWFTNCLVWLFI